MLIVGAALTNTGLTMRSHELSENSIGYIGTATLQGTEENSALNSRTSPTSNKVGAHVYFFMLKWEIHLQYFLVNFTKSATSRNHLLWFQSFINHYSKVWLWILFSEGRRLHIVKLCLDAYCYTVKSCVHTIMKLTIWSKWM